MMSICSLFSAPAYAEFATAFCIYRAEIASAIVFPQEPHSAVLLIDMGTILPQFEDLHDCGEPGSYRQYMSEIPKRYDGFVLQMFRSSLRS